MAGRGKKKYYRKLVAFRLATAQLIRLDETAKVLGKSKTAIVEDALGIYFNLLHRDGMI